MRIISIVFVSITLLSLNACTKTTKACFSFTIQDYLSHTINFDASCTQGASFYEWNFGDNSANEITSNEFILHSYNEGGDYTVTLKVTRKDGFTIGKDVFETSQVVHVP